MRLAVVVGVLLLLVAPSARAQEVSPQFEIYGWEIPAPGQPELSLWTAYVAKSDIPYLGQTRSRERLCAHTAEMDIGVTPQVSLGGYVDFEQPADARFQFTRTRLTARYNFGLQRYSYFVDPAIYVEYVIPRESYGGEEVEVRLILEKYVGDFGFRLNPTFSEGTSGDEVRNGVTLGYAAGIYYRRLYVIQPGVEGYGRIGPLSSVPPLDSELHRIFPMIRIQLANAFRWDVGAGIGLTSQTDRVVVRSVLTWEPAPSAALAPSTPPPER